MGNVGGSAVRKGNELGGRVANHVFRCLTRGNVTDRCVRRLSRARRSIGEIGVFPLRIIIHGMTTKDFTGHFKVRRNVSLPFPILRFCCGSSTLGSPFVGSTRMRILKTTATRRITRVGRRTLGVGTTLVRVFGTVNVHLVSFGVRFNGAARKRVVLTSRVSPSAYHL